MQSRRMTVVGGVSLITGALSFVIVFSYLAVNFSYPDILDGRAAEVLPRLLEGGSVMRAVWAFYAFLPLLLIPGAVGAQSACPSSRSRMTLATVFAAVGALAMCLGLMRWPSIHWVLAEMYPDAGVDAKVAIDALFTGLNVYLGNYVGEFLGETMLAAFFMLSGASMLDEDRFPSWLGWSGINVSLLLIIGAFRNVHYAVQIIADLNNLLLPLWMIVMGSSMLWFSGRERAEGIPGDDLPSEQRSDSEMGFRKR